MSSSLYSLGVRSTALPSRRHLVPDGVDGQPALIEGERLHQWGLYALGPAKHRPHPRHELTRAERLHEVVVGAGGKARDALFLAGFGREHQDRHVGAATDLSADLLARDIGQHEVEDDECRLEALRKREAFGTTGGSEDVVAVLLEVGLDDLSNRWFVVDDDDLVVVAHFVSPFAAPRSLSRRRGVRSR